MSDVPTELFGILQFKILVKRFFLGAEDVLTTS